MSPPSDRRVYAVGSGASWSEARNSSRRAEAPPGAARALLEHLAPLRGAEWYRWALAFGEASRAGTEPPPTRACRCGRHVTIGAATCGHCGRAG